MDQHRINEIFNDPLPRLVSRYRHIGSQSFPDVRTKLRYLLKLIRGYAVSRMFTSRIWALTWTR